MIIHVVAPGDTVFKIAQNYSTTQQRITQDNALENPDSLVVGQTLVILYPARTYTIQSGDTLYSISRRLGVPLKTLLRNNPQVSLHGTIYAGEELTISYTTPKIGSMAINGYAYPYIDIVTLRRTLPYLTYLSIFAYGFDNEANLSYLDDETLIAEAKEYGVAPIMMISAMNEDGIFSDVLASRMLNDPRLSDRLITNIIRNMRIKGYRGVDVDFEFINGSDAEPFARFVSDLRERANREGYLVFVALAPKTSADQSGQLYEGHDYAALGRAANRALLMTYEWGYTYGPPMAVSPIRSVRRVVEYGVSEISPGKIFLGMSNYGYDWTLPYIRGESRAQSIGNVQAVDIARRNNASIEYDEYSQAPFFYYTAEGNRHIVWFEDARSINARTALVPEFGLYGMSFWNIMRFFPQSWLVINSQYNIDTVL